MVIIMNNCNNCNCTDSSKNMYSVDYDAVINNLEKARDDIDHTIALLKDRKMKDDAINNILSSDYEDESILSEEDINEIEKLLKENQDTNDTISTINFPYYDWRYYPYRTFFKYPYYPYFLPWNNVTWSSTK